jgi:hypothetical protein
MRKPLPRRDNANSPTGQKDPLPFQAHTKSRGWMVLQERIELDHDIYKSMT